MKSWLPTRNKVLLILATLLVLGYFGVFTDGWGSFWEGFSKGEHWLDWSTLEGDNIRMGGAWNEPGNLIFVWGFFAMLLLYRYLLRLFEHIVEQQRRKHLFKDGVKSYEMSKPENEPLKGFIRVLVFIFKYVVGLALLLWGLMLLIVHFGIICSLLFLFVYFGVQIFVVSWLLIKLRDVYLGND